MNLRFSTPCAFDEGIAAASFGVSGAPDPTAKTVRSYLYDMDGCFLSGSYADILRAAENGGYQAGIVLLGNAGGEDSFIQALQQKLGCPLTGGAAAIDPVTGKSGLIAGGGQAAVWLIRDERYEVSVISENIHNILLGEHRIELDAPRVFRTIDGQDALQWYDARRKELGISTQDFEHLTFSDTLGVNAHMSVENGRLVAGRDLESIMVLRCVAADNVDRKMGEFYSDETALIFGCAGLKGILHQPVMHGGTGLFMFGEVCTVDGISRFGNLMLSKLCVKPKV